MKPHPLEGSWRITAMPDFEDGYLDEGPEPTLMLTRQGREWTGELGAGYLALLLHGRPDPDDDERLLLTFEGDDADHPVQGLAILRTSGDEARGELWSHHGDRRRFHARRA